MSVSTKTSQELLRRLRVGQQEIVFIIFAVLFAAFSVFLPGFLRPTIC